MKQLDNDLPILYEDNHVIAVCKPAGLPTQPTSHSATSCEERVKAYIKQAYQKKGNVFLHAIHRLDACTSGIVLFAKSAKALSRLNQAQREQRIQKQYLALCEGCLASGTLSQYIVHKHLHASIVPPGTAGAKPCTITWETISSTETQSLLRITLTTGRYHQIRAQLSSIRHPIIGDAKYGSVSAQVGICLHHYRMVFPHPTLGKEVVVMAEEPAWGKKKSGIVD